MVAPTERRARSAMRGDQGKPISRCCAGDSSPSATALTYTRRVHQRQFAVAGRQRLVHADRRQLALDRLAQQAVLAHREAVARRQLQREVVGVEGLHARVGSALGVAL